MWNLMEYRSAQYKPGRITVNMETITINRGRKRASNYAYNKTGCPAHMVVKKYHLYPDYQLTEKERHSMKEPQIKALKEGETQENSRGFKQP